MHSRARARAAQAADLAATKYRNELMATTMLGQCKTLTQAAIDAHAELCDFWRFNTHFAHQLFAEQARAMPRHR